MRGFIDSVNQATAANRELVASLGDLRSQTQQTSQSMSELRTSIESANTSASTHRATLRDLAAGFYDVQFAAQTVQQVLQTVWDNSVAPAGAYEVELQRIQANTGMTDQQTAAMSATIQQMAQTTSAPLDGLAQAYFRLTNEGFNAADATKILSATQQLAVGTGADVEKTTNLIGIVMHDYSISADQAQNVTSAFLRAAHLGNATMEEFADGLRKPMPVAAELGVSFQSLIAAEAELTRQGLTTEQAGTQLYNFMLRMQNPTAAQTKEIELLTQATGIDLKDAWSHAGVASMGFEGVVNLTNQALAGHNDVIQKLSPQMRGLLAAISLLGDGNQEYNSILQQVNQTYNDGTAVSHAYQSASETLAFKQGELKNSTQELQIVLGNALLPVVKDVIDWLSQNTRSMLDWQQRHQALIHDIESAVSTVWPAFKASVELMAAPITLLVTHLGDLLDAIGKSSTAIGSFLAEAAKVPGMEQMTLGLTNLAGGFQAIGREIEGTQPKMSEFAERQATGALSTEQLNQHLKQQAPDFNDSGNAAKDAAKAISAEHEATMASIQGKELLAASLRKVAQDYRDGNDEAAQSDRYAGEEAQARWDKTVQASKQGVAELKRDTKDYDTTARDLQTALDQQAKAQDVLSTATEKYGNLTTDMLQKQHVASVQGIDDALARGQAAQQGAQQELGALGTVTATLQTDLDNYQTALRAGDTVGAQFWKDQADGAKTLQGETSKSFETFATEASKAFASARSDYDTMTKDFQKSETESTRYITEAQRLVAETQKSVDNERRNSAAQLAIDKANLELQGVQDSRTKADADLATTIHVEENKRKEYLLTAATATTEKDRMLALGKASEQSDLETVQKGEAAKIDAIRASEEQQIKDLETLLEGQRLLEQQYTADLQRILANEKAAEADLEIASTRLKLDDDILIADSYQNMVDAIARANGQQVYENAAAQRNIRDASLASDRDQLVAYEGVITAYITGLGTASKADTEALAVIGQNVQAINTTIGQVKTNATQAIGQITDAASNSAKTISSDYSLMASQVSASFAQMASSANASLASIGGGSSGSGSAGSVTPLPSGGQQSYWGPLGFSIPSGIGAGSSVGASKSGGGSSIKLAGGGIIDEPVMGIGLNTGNAYSIGEDGNEAVVPLHGGPVAAAGGGSGGPASAGGGGMGGGDVTALLTQADAYLSKISDTLVASEIGTLLSDQLQELQLGNTIAADAISKQIRSLASVANVVDVGAANTIRTLSQVSQQTDTFVVQGANLNTGAIMQVGSLAQQGFSSQSSDLSAIANGVAFIDQWASSGALRTDLAQAADILWGNNVASSRLGWESSIPMASGGLLTEPVFGIGQNSGSAYSFGEAGPEWVVPQGAGGGMGGGGAPISITVNVTGGVYGDVAAAAEQLGGAILDQLRPFLRI